MFYTGPVPLKQKEVVYEHLFNSKGCPEFDQDKETAAAPSLAWPGDNSLVAVDLLGCLGLLAHVDDLLLGVGADHAGADRGKTTWEGGVRWRLGEKLKFIIE